MRTDDKLRLPTDEELTLARKRLDGIVRRTPVVVLEPGDLGQPSRLTLKLESLQHTGAFKARGALNATLVAAENGATDISAASGGNHGAAVAWAAGHAGLPATVFVPATAPQIKRDRIAALGAQLCLVDGDYDDSRAASVAHATETGAVHIDAYDDTHVVAGQATVGAELADVIAAGETVVVACGGGGLFAGTTLALAGRNPVVGAEPEHLPTVTVGIEAGEPTAITVDPTSIACDSLGARRAGVLAIEVAQRYGSRTVLVSGEEIVAAQRLLWDRLRIVAEPGGATALAAALSGRIATDGGLTVVVTGGNATI